MTFGNIIKVALRLSQICGIDVIAVDTADLYNFRIYPFSLTGMNHGNKTITTKTINSVMCVGHCDTTFSVQQQRLLPALTGKTSIAQYKEDAREEITDSR